MLERLKHWLNGRRGPGTDPDGRNLPQPKSPGDQRLSDCRLIVLDLETTGLNVAKDEVIAIGAVAIAGGVIPLDDQFDLILRRPELDIRETVLIHGIGPEALTQGHETEDALLHLLDWMNGDPVLAYHSAFDQKFLEKTLRKTLGYSRPHTWMDVADLLPAFFPDAKPGGKGLDHWAEYFGLEVSERHHAAADALATAELTLIALNKANKDGVKTLKELNNKLRYHRRLQNMHRF
ncbi:3'-5' exonuclease [Marinobacter lutaoensis]|jgi:DNA polymerase-3 subunit epsilon|uniref:DNA-directed DNA polymerase n=1 Tax=Marinobacter lutaoensis TaxID=135739 RepID=A0A1V2DP73_9GAMM|nr:3'-5' exonuclease [Marinobacter lutaoensis]MBI41964.1 3'-5' exonuclease [Oceanospirillales bacterium]NVD36552.1 3'-5' exonuclease [Marinobacter lutaoensis]ONF42453.1 DNA polymerase III subunit epsilon [Marinobacter lutaoensis]|tara:strand:+ start:5836 stop:6540 length:705 start_codon:yes stop_codon:yes gene_type:complete